MAIFYCVDAMIMYVVVVILRKICSTVEQLLLPVLFIWILESLMSKVTLQLCGTLLYILYYWNDYIASIAVPLEAVALFRIL